MWRMGGGGSPKKWDQPHEPGLFVPKCGAVLGHLKADTRAMQSSRCAGLDRLSIHGARGGAPKGKANGSYQHGLDTQEAQSERRVLSKLVRESGKMLSGL